MRKLRATDPNKEKFFLSKSKKNATFLAFGANIGKNGQNVESLQNVFFKKPNP